MRRRGLTQPDQVDEVFQALDPLDDVVVQLQLAQVLELPEVVNVQDVCKDQRREARGLLGRRTAAPRRLTFSRPALEEEARCPGGEG